MSLSIGIVGLPNVGKSTLFNALTKKQSFAPSYAKASAGKKAADCKQAETANYPFCTINPNVGVVAVPDDRLNRIAEISKPEKIISTTIEFVDIAGLVRGAHKGEGLGNKFLSHIRECDAICEVVREFENKDIAHVDGNIDPEGDKETINLELIFADLATVEKRLNKVSKEAKSGDKEMIELKNLLEKVKKGLEEGIAAREIKLDEEEKKEIKNFNLLTVKPILYVLNSDKEEGDKNWDSEVININAKLEEEIADLQENEKAEYIKELGLSESGLAKLIKASYRLLNLITFFTTGADETKAWTVRNRSKAPAAAGVIHTDFEKGFIRAEVIGYENFIKAGGEAEAKEKGYVKTEGKDYKIQDGDICHFLVSK